MRALAVISVLGILAACGGGDDGSNTTSSGVFSCDVVSGSSHGCTEYDWSGGDYPTSAWNSACTQASGTSGDGCSHAGSVGGCQLTSGSGGVTVHTTNWFYSGTASGYMTACTQAGGTFVSP